MAFLTLAAQGASLATGMIGAKMEGDNLASQYRARAEADDFNAKVAQQMAGAEKERAEASASDFRRAQKARLANARAKQAASGLSLEGSPLLVDEATFQEIEFGAARIAHQGQLASTRLENESLLLTQKAKADRMSAGFASRAGTIGAIGAGARGFANIGLTLAGRGVSFGG